MNTRKICEIAMYSSKDKDRRVRTYSALAWANYQAKDSGLSRSACKWYNPRDILSEWEDFDGPYYGTTEDPRYSVIGNEPWDRVLTNWLEDIEKDTGLNEFMLMTLLLEREIEEAQSRLTAAIADYNQHKETISSRG